MLFKCVVLCCIIVSKGGMRGELHTSYPSPHSWCASLPPVQFEISKQRSSCVELESRHQPASNGSVATVTPTAVQFVPTA